jgi:hypothetical protein
MVGYNYTAGDLVRERRDAIETCAKIAEDEAARTPDGDGEIYIARKIADRIRKLLPARS